MFFCVVCAVAALCLMQTREKFPFFSRAKNDGKKRKRKKKITKKRKKNLKICVFLSVLCSFVAVIPISLIFFFFFYFL